MFYLPDLISEQNCIPENALLLLMESIVTFCLESNVVYFLEDPERTAKDLDDDVF